MACINNYKGVNKTPFHEKEKIPLKPITTTPQVALSTPASFHPHAPDPLEHFRIPGPLLASTSDLLLLLVPGAPALGHRERELSRELFSTTPLMVVIVVSTAGRLGRNCERQHVIVAPAAVARLLPARHQPAGRARSAPLVQRGARVALR